MQQCALSFFNRINKEICGFRLIERVFIFLFDKIKRAIYILKRYINIKNIIPNMFYKYYPQYVL